MVGHLVFMLSMSFFRLAVILILCLFSNGLQAYDPQIRSHLLLVWSLSGYVTPATDWVRKGDQQIKACHLQSRPALLLPKAVLALSSQAKIAIAAREFGTICFLWQLYS